MKVNSTDAKNNFGKYLRLCVKEDVIITKNGKDIAKIIPYEETEKAESIKESVPAYNSKGTKISYEEFLQISQHSEERFEYIDGEIYLLASPKVTHQNILMELVVIFYDFLKDKPCQPAFAPFDITLRRSEENINIVQPDMMIICDMDEKTNEKDYYMGVPTLVVEIISESSRKKDYVKKLDLYLSCGIKEYWIVNPISKEMSLFYFEDKEIKENKTYKLGEQAISFGFDGLIVDTNRIFKDNI